MPDGSMLVSTPQTQAADHIRPDVEFKAHQVYALMIAAREMARGNSLYEYEDGVLESAREAVLEIALDYAADLVGLTS